MPSTDELLDAAAAEATRREMRRTVIITVVALALAVVGSTVMVLGGIPG